METLIRAATAPPAALAWLGREPDPATLARSWRIGLDCVDYPMLCLDTGLGLVWANRAARYELARPDGALWLADATVHTRSARDADLLRRAVREAAALGRGCLLSLGCDPAVIDAALMPLDDGADDAPPGQALMVIGRPRVLPPATADCYADQLGLTPAESRVLRALSAGQRPHDIARAQGVALSTVRTHLRSLRGKTGAGSIAALLRKVAALPPMLGRSG